MNLKDKIIKGNNYLINQCEKKWESLTLSEKKKFTQIDPKAYNTYKKEAEFRLRYVEAVTQLLNEQILLSEGITKFIDSIDNEGNVEEEDLNVLKNLAKKDQASLWKEITNESAKYSIAKANCPHQWDLWLK